MLYSDSNAVHGPQCEFYNSTGICRLYGSIGYDYIYTDTSIATEQVYEEEIGKEMDFVRTQDDQECADLILDMLCHHYFPACDLSQPRPQPVQVIADVLTHTLLHMLVVKQKDSGCYSLHNKPLIVMQRACPSAQYVVCALGLVSCLSSAGKEPF